MPSILKPQIFAKARTFWSWAGLFLLALILLELFSNSTLIVKRDLLKQPADTRVAADAYAQDRSWANGYWKEFYALVYRWQPFVYWRMKSTQGKYFNIDENGLRHTWNTGPSSSTPATVFMFGGSTLWGLGSRDDYTIPSYLSTMLAREYGSNVKVINYGQPAYASTQELLALLLELQHKHVPNIAIFYDGINDVTAAIQNKAGGLPLFEAARAKEFNLLEKSRRKDLFKAFVASNVKNSSTAHVLSRFGLFSPPKEKLMSQAESESLASSLVSHYAANVKVIEEIGKRRGFETLFYWQPLLPTKKHRTPYEEQEMIGLSNLNFLQAVYGRMDRLSGSNPSFHFRNLGHLLDDETKPLYIDFCHLSEPGNKKIAERMIVDVRKALKKTKSTHLP